MRYSLTALQVLTLTLALLVMVAGSTATPAAERTVYLNHLVLEGLKQSNPRHYAQAHQIMDAAAELCRPGASRIEKIDGQPEVRCAAFLKTSNPPKRQISFVLGETRYIALVTMKDAAPTFIPAGQDEKPAAKPAK